MEFLRLCHVRRQPPSNCLVIQFHPINIWPTEQQKCTLVNSATSLFITTQWLPAIKRIKFKIATLAYQSVAFGQPTYLSSVLIPHQPQRSFRSVNHNLFSVPRCNSSFGQRSFSDCVQSGMTYHFQSDSFELWAQLKTHYFANNWPPGDCLQRLWFDILDIVRCTKCMNEMNDYYDNYILLSSWNSSARC